MGQRLIIRNNQAPGDIIVLSAALRDLTIAHPGQYDVEVWVSKGAEHIYWNSPFVKAAHAGNRRIDTRDAIVHRAQYPLIKSSNQQRKHFIVGFIEHMNAELGTKVKLTEFRPAIYMTDEEKETKPFADPYWVFLSGGKKDYPTKIWAQSFWQQVIDRTCDRVNWVQCGGGSSNHIMHQAKNNIYAYMVAKTDCRNFLRLLYHAEGVVCVTTMAMHAAAAFNKPCIVIEGGREPWWWEAYNEETRRLNMPLFNPGWSPPENDTFVPHKFLHTIGKLPCCGHHGCWRKRVTGGREACRQPITVEGQLLPKCKAMITPDMVVAAIDEYLDAGLARRVEGAKLRTPVMRMRTPDKDPVLPMVDTPKIPARPKREDVPTAPADPGNVCFCLYGENTPVAIAGPKTHSINHGVSRIDALTTVLKGTEEWVIWIEEGVTLEGDWLGRLMDMLRQPAIIGRAHHMRNGSFYPYPSFFAAHRSLIKRSDTFAGSFVAKPDQFKDPTAVAKLSTVHRVPK